MVKYARGKHTDRIESVTRDIHHTISPQKPAMFGVAMQTTSVVVVAAIGAIPVPLLEDLGRAIAEFTGPPEAVVVVPA